MRIFGTQTCLPTKHAKRPENLTGGIFFVRVVRVFRGHPAPIRAIRGHSQSLRIVQDHLRHSFAQFDLITDFLDF